MAACLVISITISSLFFLLHVQSILGHCPTKPYYCQGDSTPIQFPFTIRDTVDSQCNYPRFDLTCSNQNQTIIHLPHSGDFMVTSIDYVSQSLSIDDPNGCLLGRALNFTLLDTPFYSETSYNYAFTNCTSMIVDLKYAPEVTYISCLSTQNYTIYYFPFDYYKYRDFLINKGCLVWTTSIPEIENDNDRGTRTRLRIHWDLPECRACELQGGTCYAKTYPGVGCKSGDGSTSGNGPEEMVPAHVTAVLPSMGILFHHACVNSCTELSRGIRIGICIGMGLPWFACLFVIVYYSKIKARRPGHNQRNIEHLPTNNAAEQLPQSVLGMVGLDATTIEAYPKIQINGIHELPRPNHSTCTICLAEYQQRETIRILPECSHYFHVHCIDEWFKRNVACPLCRSHKGQGVF